MVHFNFNFMNYIIMLYLPREANLLATWCHITTHGILLKRKLLSFHDRVFLFASPTHSDQNEKKNEVYYFYP